MNQKEADLITAQALLGELNKLQDDLYKKLKLYEKYKKWCTYYPYGDLDKCGDNKKQPFCDPDYENLVVDYNVDPLEYIPYIITWDGSAIATKGTTDLEFIYERIMDNCGVEGRIEDKFGDKDVTRALILEITSYVASLKYFGRVNLFRDRYFNMNNISRENTVTGLETTFGNLFGNGPFEGLYSTEVKSQFELLEDMFGSQRKLIKNGGIYIEELSYAPMKLDSDYMNAKEEYSKAYAEVLEILRNSNNLQMCLSYIDVGDINISDNETSVLNNNIQAIANCVGETANKLVEELANQNTPSSDIYVTEVVDDKKIYIIISVVVVFVLLLFGFIIFYFNRKLRNRNNNYYYPYPYYHH